MKNYTKSAKATKSVTPVLDTAVLIQQLAAVRTDNKNLLTRIDELSAQLDLVKKNLENEENLTKASWIFDVSRDGQGRMTQVIAHETVNSTKH